jgi:uncharacterized protein YkwD
MKKTLLGLFLCLTTSVYALDFDTDFQKEILNEVNHYRLSKGLTELKLSNNISSEAKEHSVEMANNSVAFGHTGFDKRMNTVFSEFDQPHGIAENVAMSPFSAQSIVKMWLNSSGHKKNIEGDFNFTGIGLAYDKNGYAYVTQIFLLAEEEKSAH